MLSARTPGKSVPSACGRKRMTDETPPADDKPKRNRSGPEPTYDGRPSAIRTALYREERIRDATLRPSDDAVQTEPLKCRHTKSGICANIAGFCLCRQANFAAAR